MKVLSLLFISYFYLLGAGLLKDGSYVIDKTNNLMWQDTRANTVMIGSQEEATEYCEELDLGGYTNWRLPEKEECEYIVDKTRDDEIMINKAFRHIKQEGYWTSSRTWRTFYRYGYYLYIKSGTFYYENRSYPKFFRCVRDTD
ncbi:MAG: DUF1566 domain-containing protein [Arcobacteraceae bacterium]|nr:DUF1566 domain-containing protein [Arcobacteraceae bacterium]